MFYLVIPMVLLGCSPYQNSKIDRTEHVGIAPSKESAINAVSAFIKMEDLGFPCGKSTFEAIEVSSTSESIDTNEGDRDIRIRKIYVDEWGIDEAVIHSASQEVSNRYWSVNGRTGSVSLVGNSGWDKALESCSESIKNT